MKVDVKSPNIIETTYVKYAIPVFQKPHVFHRVTFVFYNIRQNHLYSGFTQHEKTVCFVLYRRIHAQRWTDEI